MHEDAKLVYEQVPDPQPRPGEVAVALRTAAVNRRDLLVRRGVYPFPLPLVPGSDGAGTRRDTGEDVVIFPSLHWGEREDAPTERFEILGGPTDGTYAELVVVPEENAVPKPRGLSWPEAAALPLAGVTAHRALFARGALRAGETVLVLGAGSGVSTFLVQLAARAGARVLVTSSSEAKIERARELGAETGVLYTDDDWPEAVRKLTGGSGVDLVVDSVGSTWQQSVSCLRRGGRCVVFGATGGGSVELDVRAFYLQWKSLLGTTMGSPRDFARLLESLDRDGWSPVVDSVRPLTAAAEAHARIESGDHFGKLVLEI